MTNHYHAVIETVEENLSKGMRHLNGVYTQASNRCHNRVGHLYPGSLVDRDAYLQGVSRYVVLNPVRAGMVDSPGEWLWSSYRAMVGGPVPKWLAIDGLLCVPRFIDHRPGNAKLATDLADRAVYLLACQRHCGTLCLLGSRQGGAV